MDIFKYLGVVFDDIFFFNDYVDYVRMKVFKIFGMFFRIRFLFMLEVVNRFYKVMVFLVLDYCDVVWYECG